MSIALRSITQPSHRSFVLDGWFLDGSWQLNDKAWLGLRDAIALAALSHTAFAARRALHEGFIVLQARILFRKGLPTGSFEAESGVLSSLLRCASTPPVCIVKT